MKIKKTLRFIALILMICLACIVPFPLKFSQKDNLPKHLIEHLDIKDEEEDEGSIKELF